MLVGRKSFNYRHKNTPSPYTQAQIQQYRENALITQAKLQAYREALLEAQTHQVQGIGSNDGVSFMGGAMVESPGNSPTPNIHHIQGDFTPYGYVSRPGSTPHSYSLWGSGHGSSDTSDSSYRRHFSRSLCKVVTCCAVMLVVLAVMGIVGIAVYLGYISNEEDGPNYSEKYVGSLRIVQGDSWVPDLNFPDSPSFRAKANKYKSMLKEVYRKSVLSNAIQKIQVSQFKQLQPTSKKKLKNSSGESIHMYQDSKGFDIIFKLSFDKRQIPWHLSTTETILRNILKQELLSFTPLAFSGLKADVDHLDIKRDEPKSNKLILPPMKGDEELVVVPIRGLGSGIVRKKQPSNYKNNKLNIKTVYEPSTTPNYHTRGRPSYPSTVSNLIYEAGDWRPVRHPDDYPVAPPIYDDQISEGSILSASFPVGSVIKTHIDSSMYPPEVVEGAFYPPKPSNGSVKYTPTIIGKPYLDLTVEAEYPVISIDPVVQNKGPEYKPVQVITGQQKEDISGVGSFDFHDAVTLKTNVYTTDRPYSFWVVQSTSPTIKSTKEPTKISVTSTTESSKTTVRDDNTTKSTTQEVPTTHKSAIEVPVGVATERSTTLRYQQGYPPTQSPAGIVSEKSVTEKTRVKLPSKDDIRRVLHKLLFGQTDLLSTNQQHSWQVPNKTINDQIINQIKLNSQQKPPSAVLLNPLESTKRPSSPEVTPDSQLPDLQSQNGPSNEEQTKLNFHQLHSDSHPEPDPQQKPQLNLRPNPGSHPDSQPDLQLRPHSVSIPDLQQNSQSQERPDSEPRPIYTRPKPSSNRPRPTSSHKRPSIFHKRPNSHARPPPGFLKRPSVSQESPNISPSSPQNSHTSQSQTPQENSGGSQQKSQISQQNPQNIQQNSQSFQQMSQTIQENYQNSQQSRPHPQLIPHQPQFIINNEPLFPSVVVSGQMSFKRENETPSKNVHHNAGGFRHSDAQIHHEGEEKDTVRHFGSNQKTLVPSSVQQPIEGDQNFISHLAENLKNTQPLRPAHVEVGDISVISIHQPEIQGKPSISTTNFASDKVKLNSTPAKRRRPFRRPKPISHVSPPKPYQHLGLLKEERRIGHILDSSNRIPTSRPEVPFATSYSGVRDLPKPHTGQQPGLPVDKFRFHAHSTPPMGSRPLPHRRRPTMKPGNIWDVMTTEKPLVLNREVVTSTSFLIEFGHATTGSTTEGLRPVYKHPTNYHRPKPIPIKSSRHDFSSMVDIPMLSGKEMTFITINRTLPSYPNVVIVNIQDQPKSTKIDDSTGKSRSSNAEGRSNRFNNKYLKDIAQFLGINDHPPRAATPAAQFSRRHGKPINMDAEEPRSFSSKSNFTNSFTLWSVLSKLSKIYLSDPAIIQQLYEFAKISSSARNQTGFRNPKDYNDYRNIQQDSVHTKHTTTLPDAEELNLNSILVEPWVTLYMMGSEQSKDSRIVSISGRSPAIELSETPRNSPIHTFKFKEKQSLEDLLYEIFYVLNKDEDDTKYSRVSEGNLAHSSLKTPKTGEIPPGEDSLKIIKAISELLSDNYDHYNLIFGNEDEEEFYDYPTTPSITMETTVVPIQPPIIEAHEQLLFLNNENSSKPLSSQGNGSEEINSSMLSQLNLAETPKPISKPGFKPGIKPGVKPALTPGIKPSIKPTRKPPPKTKKYSKYHHDLFPVMTRPMHPIRTTVPTTTVDIIYMEQTTHKFNVSEQNNQTAITYDQTTSKYNTTTDNITSTSSSPETLHTSYDVSYSLKSGSEDIVLKANSSRECTAEEFQCPSGKCIPSLARCNMVRDCEDNADEATCSCAQILRGQHYDKKICDGIIDCWDKSDETGCDWCMPGFFICTGYQKCVPPLKVCDGSPDCPNGDDERDCVTIAPNAASANSIDYFDEGFLMVRRSGVWGKLCVDNFESAVSKAGVSWSVNDLGKAVCNTLTFQSLNEVSQEHDSTPPTFRSVDTPYYEINISKSGQSGGNYGSRARMLSDGKQLTTHLNQKRSLSSSPDSDLTISELLSFKGSLKSFSGELGVTYEGHRSKRSPESQQLYLGDSSRRIKRSQFGERNTADFDLSLQFQETECPMREVVKVACDDLQCGIRPRATTQQARIVGGSSSSPGAWPWHAALYKEGEYQCGATLISGNWLISAGHCFFSAKGSYWVARMGALRRGTKFPSPFEQVRTLSHIFIHPEYINHGFINDISLLRLSEPIVYSDYVRPVCLPSPAADVTDGQRCTLVGWGQLFEVKKVFPDTLQEVEVPLISTNECRKQTIFLPLYRITEDMFCAGYDRGGRDACLGDSGGPLMCQKADGQWELMGVTSNGYGCARPNRPGVYTKVANFRTWIEQMMKLAEIDRIVSVQSTCDTTRCPLGECLPQDSICNGLVECSDGSDEDNC